mgnify:CR=1 FL=1
MLWRVDARAGASGQNLGMLRLAASHPPLWRTPSSLQLGTEAAVHVDAVSPWQERLLAALADGIPDAMLVPLARSFGATAEEASAFAARIDHALAREHTSPLQIQVELPDTLTVGEREALVSGWDAAGMARVSLSSWASDAPQRGIPLVVVADRLLDPRRAARLMRADVTHLPVELAGDRVHVGPLIVPGRTACAACLHAHRADADPQWPLLAAQLLGREPVRTGPALLVEAALLSARLLRESSPAPADASATLSVGLSAAHARRTWHAHRPHARCLCRSPEGNATAAADAFPNAPTSSRTGIARPA